MCKNYNWASRTFYPIKKIAYVSQYSFSEKKKKKNDLTFENARYSYLEH